MTSVQYSVSLHNLSSGGNDLPEPVDRGPAWGLAGAATAEGGAPGEASLHPAEGKLTVLSMVQVEVLAGVSVVRWLPPAP